jgi:hypothetical protein
MGVEQPAHAPRALSLATAVLCCVSYCSAGLFFSFHGAIRTVGLPSDGLALFLSTTYLLVAFAMFLTSSTTLLFLPCMFCGWGGAGLLTVTLWPLVARCNRNRNRNRSDMCCFTISVFGFYTFTVGLCAYSMPHYVAHKL